MKYLIALCLFCLTACTMPAAPAWQCRTTTGTVYNCPAGTPGGIAPPAPYRPPTQAYQPPAQPYRPQARPSTYRPSTPSRPASIPRPVSMPRPVRTR